ncbi:endonuclease domain-containing protein [Mycolicibacterium sp. GCM10028919]|uniref:endonuclease domain-containing protein n=1 Tax=Mycolicibacterium sp. GCM10028919 TaxID=3273401 RepID=UPI00361401C5
MQPFIGSAAVRRGELSRRGLAREHVAIYRDVYLHRDVELTALVRARAAWLATGATLVGVSAAAVHGTKWLDGFAPAEIVRPDRHAAAGLVVHSWALGADDVCVVGGVDVTTAARTAFDIGRTRDATQAIPILDALFNSRGLKHGDVSAVADAHPGVRGVASLRAMLPNVDGGAESPQETRLRLILVAAGLPRPETQIRFPELHVRVDMGWREWKVAVEYDGVQHWADPRQRSWDIERIALLEAAGWVVVRVSADMMSRPGLIVARVRDKLRARGCPV